MSLINQMLRDLEKRNSTNNTPPTLQHNIQATQTPASKMPLLLWSAFSIAAAGGTYWAYQYSKTLIKAPAVTAADDIKKDPTPIAPYEKVLTASNAIIDVVQKTEQPPLKNTAHQQAPAIQSVPEFPAAPASQPVPTAPVAQPKPSAQIAPPVSETAAELTAKKESIAPKAELVRQINSKQQASFLYQKIEKDFENYSAINKLEQVLKLDPRHLKARLLLAKTLYNQGQTDKTAEFLDQSLTLFPDNLQFINTRAQLFLQQKDPNGAFRTLQRVDLANSSNEAYLSLLAATYQQLQSFANAAKVYQKLVTINPEKAENWLGLGLSQEKLGNLKLARDAYQQALNKNTLKESIASYIKQRLIELR